MTELETLYAMKKGDVAETESLMPGLSPEKIVIVCDGMDKGRQRFTLYWHDLWFANVAIDNLKGRLVPVEIA